MKERLDILLVNRGLAGSRSRARELILSGKVYADGRKADKAGNFYDGDIVEIQIHGDDLKYVSRGGLKLEKAVEKWQLDLKGKICMDIGASTGGFTDCMLQNGAARVYSVDVGRDQLAEKLRNDDRVVCMEQTNFRYMRREDIREELDFASVDVSFISLTRILAPAGNLLKRGGQMVCLIKPQFEAGKGRVGKNGVVRDPGIHREVIENVADYAAAAGFAVLHLDYSPVRGPEGNIEYLMHLEKGDEPGEEKAVKQLLGPTAERTVRQLSMPEKEVCGREEWSTQVQAGRSKGMKWKQRIAETVEAAWKAL